MLRYLATLTQFKRDEKGVTALEYGLIAALIAVVIIGAVTNLGSQLNTTFTNISAKMAPASSTGGAAAAAK